MFLKRLKILSASLVIFLISFELNFEVSAQDTTKNTNGAVAADQAIIDQGATLFKQNCVTCHAIHDVVVGPALKDVHKRRQLPWIISFVKNSTKVIASGDQYAVDLYNKYNKTQMTSFPNLSDAEITSIVEYIKVEGSKAPVTAQAVDGAKDASSTDKSNASNPYGDLTIILLVVILVLVLVILIVFSSVLRKYLKDKEANLEEADKVLVNQKIDFVAFFKSKGFITVVSIVFVAWGARACWNTMFYVGVEQGYQPVQPIPFSHKLHAGEYKIDCNYCHTGVTKGKQANIPSLNICMNCHSQIKKGPKYGEAAIAKVVKAYETNTPVKWVRIHNLPDLSYFNHAQHVKVGGLECTNCHGQIDTMEVVHQHAPLTMGWCINCHRETKVNGKDNDYYAKLLESHNQVSKKDLKVADIGGLECSKCHY
ncbi:MAG: cytochrome C [Cytophagales bacterium]|nr:MAG: cytochrome C [Cytophagales bacterium]